MRRSWLVGHVTALVVAGCGSSSSPHSGDSGVVLIDSGSTHDGSSHRADAKHEAAAAVMFPTCKGETAAEGACNACVAAMCSSVATKILAACKPYYTCFAECDCTTDDSCVMGCKAHASASCVSTMMSEGSMCTACDTTCGISG